MTEEGSGSESSQVSIFSISSIRVHFFLIKHSKQGVSSSRSQLSDRGSDQEQTVEQQEEVTAHQTTPSRNFPLELRTAIIECNGDKVCAVLCEAPYLIETCIESSVKGNFPIHWAAVAINGCPMSTDNKSLPISALIAVLQFENNVNRMNENGATALHLISTQVSDSQEKFALLAAAVGLLMHHGAEVKKKSLFLIYQYDSFLELFTMRSRWIFPTAVETAPCTWPADSEASMTLRSSYAFSLPGPTSGNNRLKSPCSQPSNQIRGL